MPAIVRVKRRIDEEPLNSFVLNGKKRRLEQTTEPSIHANDDGKDEISTVLKFAGTIQEPDNNATTQFARRINITDAKDLVQGKSARKAGNYTERARQNVRETTQENRFRVVNCMRTTLRDDDENDIEQGEGNSDIAGASKPEEIKSLTIVDIEKQTNETETSMPMQQQQAQQMPADSDTGYVYDLYLPDDDIQARNADLMDDNYLSILPVDNIFFEDTFNDAEDEDYDSEDSNREDYFTNDYPDEDDDQELHSANEYDDESEDIRHMRQAVENFVFGDDDDSEKDIYDDASSEDGADYYTYEDPYVQTIEFDNFVADIDAYEGPSYESCKKKLKKRLDKDLSEEDDDDDENEESDEDKNGKLNRSSDLDYHSANEQE